MYHSQQEIMNYTFFTCKNYNVHFTLNCKPLCLDQYAIVQCTFIPLFQLRRCALHTKNHSWCQSRIKLISRRNSLGLENVIRNWWRNNPLPLTRKVLMSLHQPHCSFFLHPWLRVTAHFFFILGLESEIVNLQEPTHQVFNPSPESLLLFSSSLGLSRR